MPRAPSRYYLYCQSVGWGMLLGVYIASGLLFLHLETIKSLENAFITAFLTGLFMTHLLRLAILKPGLAELAPFGRDYRGCYWEQYRPPWPPD
jgi:hypothetical protein